MAQLWATVGDSWVNQTKWYSETHTAGLGEDGEVYSYIPPSAARPLIYQILQRHLPTVGALGWRLEPLQMVYCHVMSTPIKPTVSPLVTSDKLKDMEPWKPKSSLLGAIKVNDKGEIVTEEATLRQLPVVARMVNPRSQIGMECGRRACPTTLTLMYSLPLHSLLTTRSDTGERGELPIDKHFQWRTQHDDTLIENLVPPQERISLLKPANPTVIEGRETIDINEGLKKKQKRLPAGDTKASTPERKNKKVRLTLKQTTKPITSRLDSTQDAATETVKEDVKAK
ncbi:hypothetical protein M422DRAFT_50232 [Sphaerobolus stellatus SS14]|uniref:Uncharacterized protein n=1 Tax=Sphaerobolus stellatus (strain SS14) TaxID=990650 RepID=A0A0C9VKF8_SPHS4|nr:hypothetical protein M422DRAFT_50232 [Sphaerobolus stellatus SS14]